MGTRADFYVGRGQQAEWLGSVGYDGYPEGIERDVLEAVDADKYREHVLAFLKSKRSGTLPEQGWPWPWDNSKTTDYAYAFDDGKVWASCFGSAWVDISDAEPDEWPEDKSTVFPDMNAVKNVQMGNERSGFMLFGL